MFWGGLTIIDGDTITSPLTTADDIVFFDFDSSGTISNKRTLIGQGYTKLLSMCRDHYDNIYLSGAFQSSIFLGGTQQIVSTGGAWDGFVANFGNTCITPVFELTHEKNILLYPNPAKETIHLNCKEIQGRKTASVYSIMGALLIQQMVEQDEFTLEVNNLAAGIYLLRVSNDKGESGLVRFVKE